MAKRVPKAADVHDGGSRFRTVGDGSGIDHDGRFYREEIQLAFRNRGIFLEGLRYPITPTGMHYLLVHFDVPDIDAHRWRLAVGGLVSRPLRMTLDEIKRRPVETLAVTMECAGNGRALLNPRPVSQPWLVEAVSTAEWTGTPLRGILEEASVRDEAVELLFTGLDRGVQGDEVQQYERSLSIEEAMRDEVLLAYEMNGQPLQPQHGYPLRLIVPGWYGMASVKWLDTITAIAEPFHGYQMDRSYRYSAEADDPGEPVSLIKVRALMIPPGIPDFLTRTRVVQAGPVVLMGRAWAGRLEVSKVEVSTDGGSTWSEARLEETTSPFAWRGWSYEWRASPGRRVLCVRATDGKGTTQPVDQSWNFHGMGNNMVQRVDVVVE
jgi:DMSO/TMAO reductase YedYZ molybdopterin-dependent catalytic subunit